MQKEKLFKTQKWELLITLKDRLPTNSITTSHLKTACWGLLARLFLTVRNYFTVCCWLHIKCSPRRQFWFQRFFDTDQAGVWKTLKPQRYKQKAPEDRSSRPGLLNRNTGQAKRLSCFNKKNFMPYINGKRMISSYEFLSENGRLLQ